MRAIEFEEQNLVLGKGQEDTYIPMPAYYNKDELSMAFCFELNKEEIDEIIATGKIWFKQLTFNKPFQPVMLSTQKEDILK